MHKQSVSSLVNLAKVHSTTPPKMPSTEADVHLLDALKEHELTLAQITQIKDAILEEEEYLTWAVGKQVFAPFLHGYKMGVFLGGPKESDVVLLPHHEVRAGFEWSASRNTWTVTSTLSVGGTVKSIQPGEALKVEILTILKSPHGRTYLVKEAESSDPFATM